MSGFTVHDCAQGSPEWFAARAGIPTASQFDTVMAQGRAKGSPSVTRRKYMLTLIGEALSCACVDSYSNAHMERGHQMEQEARDLYAMVSGHEPVQVGFMRRALPTGDAGASPDSLIGDDGLLEIKTALPHIQLERFLAGELPAEHRAQVQGQLWISGRQWADFVSYWPALPILIVRVARDEQYIETIAQAVADFNSEMAALTEQIARRAA